MLKTVTLAALMAITEQVSLDQCCNTCACNDHDHEEVDDIMVDVIDEIEVIVDDSLREKAAAEKAAADAAAEKAAADAAAEQAAADAAAEKAAADAAAEQAAEAWKALVQTSAYLGPYKPANEREEDVQDIEKLKEVSTGMPIISAIEVNHNNSWVYGVTFSYADGSEFKHIARDSDDSVPGDKVYLEPDELIIAAGGRFGLWADQLFFTTSDGRTLKFGGTGGYGDSSCDFSSADQPVLLALGVGFNPDHKTMESMQCHFLDMADLEYTP